MKLTKISEKMLSYFVENNCIKHKNQTVKTDTIFLKLYDDIKESYLFLLSNKKTKGEKLYNINIKKITSRFQIPKPNILDYNSFPKSIMEHIEQKSTFIITYNLSL